MLSGYIHVIGNYQLFILVGYRCSSMLWQSSSKLIGCESVTLSIILYQNLDDVGIGLFSVQFDSAGISNSCDEAVTFSLRTGLFLVVASFSTRPAVGSDTKLFDNSVSKESLRLTKVSTYQSISARE